MKNLRKLIVVLIVVCQISIAYSHNTAKNFTEKALTLKTPEGILYGTLLTPKSSKKPPLVIFITGSIGTDRNGNMENNPDKNNWVAYLADSLAQKGIASFRYDKIGTGISKITKKEMSLYDVTYDVNVAHSISWLLFFSKKRKEFPKQILFGHGDGSTIGLVASNVVNVDGFISACASGSTNDRVIESLYFPSIPDKLRDIGMYILAEMRAGRTTDSVPLPLIPLFGKEIQPIIISGMKYDPSQKVKTLPCPLLIVYAEYDLDMPESETLKLAAASPTSKVLKIPSMNHIFKEVRNDYLKNRGTYSIPVLPIIDGITDKLADFINSIP